MTNPPPYRLIREDSAHLIDITDPPAMEPVDIGSRDHPRPSMTDLVTIRTMNGKPTSIACEGRRILKRDNDGNATGARTYQMFALSGGTVHDAWGVTPPQWVRDMYDAWRSGNVVDGRQ